MAEVPPVVSPEVKAGLLALTLDEAMCRLHRSHGNTDWRDCGVSTLCSEASRLLDDCELEMAAARIERGE